MARFVYTFFNCTDEEYEKLLRLSGTFHVIGKEKTQLGSPHLQGYVEFFFPLSYPAFKRIMGRGCHIERAKNSREANVAYCTKGGDYVIIQDGIKYSSKDNK